MPLIAREQSVLVVVDAQPGFTAQASMDAAERAAAASALARIRWLLGLAGLLGVPAVLTEEEPDRNGATDADVRAAAPPGTPTVEKATFGLASEPQALAAVRETERTTAVLTGFETDVCVAQSAIGLRDLGFRVAVVEDACGSSGPAEHAAGLQRMADAGVERIAAKALVYEWLRRVDVAIDTFQEASRRFGDPPMRL